MCQKLPPLAGQCAGDRDQQDDQNVVHHGGTQERDPHPAPQDAQFYHRLGRDADAGGRQHQADEHSLQQGEAEEERYPQPQDDGEEDAQDTSPYRGPPRPSHRLHVHLQTSDKHQEKDAQVGQFAERLLQVAARKGRPVEHVQHRRAQDEADEQLPQHRWLPQPGAQVAEGFGREDDDGQGQQKREQRVHVLL
jgi:hypothetical protein